MKTKNGITLIALIITIIVMLILVSVTVTTAIKGGLFDAAIMARQRHEEEYIKERLQIAIVDTIDDDLIKYNKEYLKSLGVNLEGYTNLEKLGYHTGAGGICNLFKLKKELEKIFNKEISKGEISIKMTIIGNNIYEDLTDEKVAEYYNDFYWSDYLATGDAIEKDNEYIKEKYKEIYEKETQFTENEITEIKNGTGIYSKENNKNSAAMQKAYIDCMVIEIGYKNKIFTITSTGEIILETTGEIITNSEIMSIRDAYKVFKFKGDRIIQYIGQEKTVRVPKSIGTVEENYKIKELGYKDSNDRGNIGGYNASW